jgi:hypothetical protein
VKSVLAQRATAPGSNDIAQGKADKFMRETRESDWTQSPPSAAFRSQSFSRILSRHRRVATILAKIETRRIPNIAPTLGGIATVRRQGVR